MAPPKSRAAAAAAAAAAAHEDINSHSTAGSSLKEGRTGSGKNGIASASNTRGRKAAATTNLNVNEQTTTASTVASSSLPVAPPGAAVTQPTPESRGDWIQDDLTMMARYKSLFRLPGPTAYTLPHSRALLETGLGQYSPTTIARKRRGQALITKDTLASVVRPHFKALAVNENDVLAEFFYNIKTADKSFRYKGSSTRKR